MWKHSSTGYYQVNKAYNLLHKSYMENNSNLERHLDIHNDVWTVLWKVKLPLKVLTFVWKLLHDCLPVKLMLANRGIPVVDVCPMCNGESESPSHLFLYCDLARAVWHGSELSIKTTELNQVLVKPWLARCILMNRKLDLKNLKILQTMFTTLWTIWNHRNQVVHEGKCPNPIEIILTSQNLLCRYQMALTLIKFQALNPAATTLRERMATYQDRQ